MLNKYGVLLLVVVVFIIKLDTYLVLCYSSACTWFAFVFALEMIVLEQDPLLITGSLDGTIRVWRLDTFELVEYHGNNRCT